MSRKTLLQVVCTAVLLSVSAFAVDGVVLINQNTVMAAGGFPYKITQPGSYKLSGNLVVTSANIGAATSVIEIDADNVTLDLNGFSILGPTTCTGSPVICNSSILHIVEGIFSRNSNLSIMNGAIQGMLDDGIKLLGGNERIENVTASQNEANGIELLAGDGIVSRCIASSNGNIGIEGDGVVESSTATLNGFTGIDVINGTVSGNVAFRNVGVGIFVELNGLANANTLVANEAPDLRLGTAATSNHNNNCSGTAC